MKYKFFAGLIACVLSATTLMAQKKGKHEGSANRGIELLFDSTGKLISFPPAIVRKNRIICLKIAVPVHFVFSQVNTFRSMLVETYNALTKDQAKERSYACYFENATHFKFNSYLQDIENAIDCLDGILSFKNTGLDQTIAQLGAFKYFPADSFIANVFYNQFEVGISRGSDLLKSVKLKTIEYDRKNQCFYFKGCQKINDLCSTCGSPESDQLSFQLFRTDPLAQTLKDWFEQQNALLGSEDMKLNDIKKGLVGMSTNSLASTAFFNGHGMTTTLKDWYPLWFWYTKGEFVIDPFQIQPQPQNWTDSLTGKLKELNKAIDSVKQQKVFIDSSLVKINYSVAKFDTFKYAQDMSLAFARQLDNMNTLKQQTEKKINGKSSATLNTHPRSYLNKVSIYFSSFSHIRPQVQFDGSNSYGLIANGKRQIHRVTELPDNENGCLIVHNVDSSLTVNFNQLRTAFADNEEFTQWVADALSKIELTGLPQGGLDNLQNFAKSFFAKSATLGLAPISASDINCTYDDTDSTKMNPVYKTLQKLAKDYVNKQLTVFYEKSIFSDDLPTKPVYRSESEMVKFNSDFPFKDSVSVKQVLAGKETTTLLTNVKVGKLRFEQVAAGIAMTDHPTTVTTIDTTGSGFRVSSTDNKARAVIGFKLYPFQNYQRDRWLIPRYPLHRISVFGGFEILHPINNFYIGGCYDIVPGLGFSVGKNFYLQTNYKIENNVVTNTYRNYKSSGYYYAVVVNPTLFVQFVKLFFK